MSGCRTPRTRSSPRPNANLARSPPSEVLVSIRRVHAGKKYIPAEVASEIADYFTEDGLTAREVETLHLVAARQP